MKLYNKYIWLGIILIITGVNAVDAETGLKPVSMGIGMPFIQNFSPNTYKTHGQNFAIVQDNRGVMYFGNFAGILEYDGIYWRLITTAQHKKVSSLSIDKTGRIYVGARGEIGYLAPDSLGKMAFVSLIDKIKPEYRDFLEIPYIYTTAGNIYFVAENKIFRLRDDEFTVLETDNPVLSAFCVNDKLYVLLKNMGLMSIKDWKFEPIEGGERFSETTEIDIMLPMSGNKILIGSGNRGLFILDDKSIEPFSTDFDSSFIESKITSGVMLKDSSYAFGTIRNGVIIIFPDGRARQILNKDSGIQNEYVRNIFIDHEEALWLALNNGITRVEMPSPLTYIDEKSGIKGGITQIVRCNSSLYFSSYQGLYYLDRNSMTVNLVPGIISACWSIICAGNSILAATSEGVYQVQDDKILPITKSFSLVLHRSKFDSTRIYAGQTDGLVLLQLDNGKWVSKGKIEGISDEIRQIFEDEDGVIWLGTPYRGIFSYNPRGDSAIEHFDTLKGLPSITGNQLNILSGMILVTSMSGVFKYNKNSNSFEPINLFDGDTTRFEKWIYKIIEDSEGNFWGNSGNEANIALFTRDRNGKYIENKTPFLPISDFITWSIYPESDGVTWFGGPDGLVRYDLKVDKNYIANFNSLIRKVVVNNDSLLFAGSFFSSDFVPSLMQNDFLKPILNYKSNTIRFEYSATSFNVKGQNEFQYYLEGFDAVRSEWTTETTKEYTNLPEGKYIFRVRSKNVYKHLSAEASFEFEILTPWFKTWWAYAVYLILLGILISIIVVIRSRQLVKEKRILEGLVTERTAEVVQQTEELHKQSLELESKNEELGKINDFVKSINSEIHFTNLLRSIMEKARAIKSVEDATALIYDKNADTYRFKATLAQEAAEFESIQLTIDELEMRYLKNAEEVFEDIFINNRFVAGMSHRELDKLEKPKSMLIMIVKVKNRIEGFILLENKSKQEAFDSKDLSLVKNLKEHIISAFIKTKILADLQVTLDNLKDAQAQLIQSEKLASLGQLTAGIAHEIQNPLNFVNNFAELSVDLTTELKEYIEEQRANIDADLLGEIEDVIGMLESNALKINEHGKRAESIVKGMLQHSRGKPGEFEQTDINSMVAEYVNLSYHGMRAQNREFNTGINSDYDDSIGKIRIIPQDLSRVIMNILNNACYAVNEKKEKQKEGYSPQISISTKKLGDKVEIRIKDNGTGMPQSVIDKIFNPFFSTKPTGKGTGLGLSMSYDIVTQIHKGTIEVNSKDGEYTEFVIGIPLNL